MNFQKLLVVETSDKYLDFAFSSGKKKAEELKDIKANSKIDKSKKIESERITNVRNTLNSHLKNILRSFPQFEDLPDFYRELVKLTIDYKALMKSLGGVSWALRKIDFFYIDYNKKILKTQEIGKINIFRREFYGRISSVMRQIKKELLFLEESRKIMKGFPAIKTSLKTVCIFGFPNVGKSTLLWKITGATPEIKNYAFTTKKLNLGTLNIDNAGRKIQFIDTPGTLNRFNMMNIIEQQAYLALKYCCDAIIYIFDLTESYPLGKQYALFDSLLKFHSDKPVFIYLSKTDLIEKAKVNGFLKDFKRKYCSKDKSDYIIKESPASNKDNLIKSVLNLC
ncbi:MAG: GTPase [Candidatus Woesearchaeota archaeon]